MIRDVVFIIQVVSIILAIVFAARLGHEQGYKLGYNYCMGEAGNDHRSQQDTEK